MHIIHVPLEERAILSVNGVPTAWLRPGRHVVFKPLSRVSVRRLRVESLVVDLRPEEAALAPSSELITVEVAAHERAIVWLGTHPLRWLGAGRHRVLTVDKDVHVQVLDTSAVEARPLEARLRALAPASDYVELTVVAGTAAMRFVDGTLDAVLGPGRHAAWLTTRTVKLVGIDLRERVLSITGQEVMTRDRVTLRLNISAVFQVADVNRLATVARDADEALYLAMQMVARDAVTARTLEQLLGSRDTLAAEMLAAAAPRAEAVGLRLASLGLKDVILPGEIRELMNKVVEAQKVAEANVIMRREETAATRSLAQTAQLLAEHPTLLRLKELEAYKDLAQKVGTVHLVMGEGALPGLQILSK